MGAGFARLNSLTIIQTSQGLAEYLLSVLPNAAAHGIVVGHDARHNSQHFADLAAAVFESKGIVVWWYEDIVHTPLVPFAVKTLRAAAGIMITVKYKIIYCQSFLMAFAGKPQSSAGQWLQSVWF